MTAPAFACERDGSAMVFDPVRQVYVCWSCGGYVTTEDVKHLMTAAPRRRRPSPALVSFLLRTTS